jgi:hypothetical protein
MTVIESIVRDRWEWSAREKGTEKANGSNLRLFTSLTLVFGPMLANAPTFCSSSS